MPDGCLILSFSTSTFLNSHGERVSNPFQEIFKVVRRWYGKEMPYGVARAEHIANMCEEVDERARQNILRF